MILPEDFALMCRINYKGLHAYQKVSLCDYNNMLAKFPVGVTVDALSFWPNKIYGWTRIESVELGVETATQEILTDKRGLTFKAPKHAKDLKFVTLPKGFFDSDGRSVKEKVLGVISSSYVKDFEIRAKDRTRKLTIHGLFKGSISSFSGLVLRINGNIFSCASFDRDIDTVLTDYVSVFYKYPIDVYLTHVLIQNRLLLPFIFGGDKPEFDEEELRVPFDTYWVFQLLYGRHKSICFEMSEPSTWGKVDIMKLKTRLRRTYTKADGAILRLRSTSVQPVIINGFAMRFV